MDRPFQEAREPGRRIRNKHRRQNGRRQRGASGGRAPAIPLTEEGVPAATPDAPRPSPAVFVSDASLAEFPWLPRRVIAGSVWRGPGFERVRVDEGGNAVPWRTVTRS